MTLSGDWPELKEGVWNDGIETIPCIPCQDLQTIPCQDLQSMDHGDRKRRDTDLTELKINSLFFLLEGSGVTTRVHGKRSTSTSGTTILQINKTREDVKIRRLNCNQIIPINTWKEWILVLEELLSNTKLKLNETQKLEGPTNTIYKPFMTHWFIQIFTLI